jgi:tetratricopeptide (TPR) repeat protein
LVLVVFCVAGVLLANGWKEYMIYDEAGYYAYLTSLVLDHDLDLANDLDLARLGTPDWERLANTRTTTGASDDKFPIGPALLWSPFFVIGQAATLGARSLGLAVPADGYVLTYKVFTIAGTYVLSVLGLVATIKLAQGAGWGRTPVLGVLLAFLGTFWAYYVFVSPLMAHALSIATSSWFCLAWMNDRAHPTAVSRLVLGIAAALTVLVRWQSLILVLSAFAIDMIDLVAAGHRRMQGSPSSRCLGRHLWLGIGLIGLTPQLLVWGFQYGRFLTFPQGVDFMHWGDPRIPDLLFSSWHGLFSTHPLVLVGAAGLFLLKREHRPLLSLFLLAFLGMSLVNGAADDWWAGMSFGMRRFDSLIPLVAVGLTSIWERAQRGVWRAMLGTASIVLVSGNLALALMASEGRVHPGFPLGDQVPVVRALLEAGVRDILALVSPSSPLGSVVLALRVGHPNPALWVSWAVLLLSVAPCFVALARRTGLQSGSRRFAIGPGSWYGLALTSLLVSCLAIGAAARNTDLVRSRAASLVRSRLLLGQYDAAQREINPISGAHSCEVDYIEMDLARRVGNVTDLTETAVRVAELCGPPGWMRLLSLRSYLTTEQADTLVRQLRDYASWYPRPAGILLDLARFERSRGEVASAASLLELALTYDPNDVGALFQFGDLLRSQGAVEEARATYERVRGSPGAYSEAILAEMSRFQGDDTEWSTRLDRAVSLVPGDPVARVFVADTALRTGDANGAEALYAEALRDRPQMTLGHWYPSIQIAAGWALLGLAQAGDSSQQADVCHASDLAFDYAISRHLQYSLEGLARAEIAVASDALEAGDRQSASVHLETSISALLESSEVMVDLEHNQLEGGEILLSHGWPEEASALVLPLTEFFHPRAGLTSLPNTDVLLSLAEQTYREHLLGAFEIRQWADSLLASVEDERASGTQIASVRDAVRDVRDRLLSSESYVYWWTPRDISEAYVGRSQALQCQGRLEEAASILGDAAVLYPSSPGVSAALGEVESRLGDPTAGERYATAVSAAPGDYWLRLGYAQYLMREGDPAEAFNEVATAVAGAPGYAVGYKLMRDLLVELERPELADLALGEAMRAEPGWVRMFVQAPPPS